MKLEDAKRLTKYASVFWIGSINQTDPTEPFRVQVRAKVKTWKRRPGDIEVPVKSWHVRSWAKPVPKGLNHYSWSLTKDDLPYMFDGNDIGYQKAKLALVSRVKEIDAEIAAKLAKELAEREQEAAVSQAWDSLIEEVQG